jgi:hypothetical protein
MNRLLPFLTLPLAFALISCTNGGSSPQGQPAPQSPAGKDNSGPAGPVEPNSSGSNTGTGTDSASANCPWNLRSSPTVAAYSALGIQLEVDCAAIGKLGPYDYQYSAADLEKPLSALDSAISVFKDSDYKPATISLAPRALHDSKKDLLQIKLSNDPITQDFARVVAVTLQLMKIEKTEFDSQVRFNYSRIEKGTLANGQRVDLGAPWMTAPSQETVDKDIAAIRKFKKQLLAHKDMLPDVVLFHGNEMAHYDVSAWDQSYFFSSDVSDDLNMAFFDYLTRYERLARLYSPIELTVKIYRTTWTSFKADFQRTKVLFETGEKIRDLLTDKRIQWLMLWERDSASLNIGDDQLSLSFNGQRLLISNIFDSLNRPLDIGVIRQCLQGLDFSAPFNKRCPDL